MAKKKAAPIEVETQDEIVENAQVENEVLKPEIIEPKKDVSDKFNLKPGECVIEIVAEGKEKGTQFKTTLKMAERSFGNPEKYVIVKKN